MKNYIILWLILVFGLAVSACGRSEIVATATGVSVVEDQVSFLSALRTSNATVVIGDPVMQDFFTPEGRSITVNGADVQVFEYEDSKAMEAEASLVSPDGSSVGTSMMMWVDKPHFYKAGRMIVLYVGSDQATQDLLEKILGSQFAGQ